MTTAAGLVSLQHLTADQIDAMAVRATELETVLSKAAAGLGVPLSVRRSGSMLQLFLSEVAPDAIPERTDGGDDRVPPRRTEPRRVLPPPASSHCRPSSTTSWSARPASA